ncbi:MAG: saccharopine dehydrogenase family protein [Fimbriimonadaceae bacterium]
MSTTYAILGAGMQGTSAAYDLAKYADATSILFGDMDPDHAERAATRVNALVGRAICKARKVDALDPANLTEFLEPASVVLSCVPYWMHPHVAPAAIASKTHMVDMGGNTTVTRQTLRLDAEARAAGVTIVPDTGLAPGLVNNLGAYLIERLDLAESIKLYCGGLPQHPKPPFNYKLVFNIEGLLTEYNDEAEILRDGRITSVPTLEELEALEIDGLGAMEAFTTSGGTSTAPETWQGCVKNYEYKTIRYPGHCGLMKVFKEYGFWGREAVDVRSGKAVPREVFEALMGPALKDPTDRDLVVVRAIGVGKAAGSPGRHQIDILQRHDEATGFTAMEQLTGMSTAIYAAAIAAGEMETGCLRYESALTGHRFMDEMRRRPVNLSTNPA